MPCCKPSILCRYGDSHCNAYVQPTLRTIFEELFVLNLGKGRRASLEERGDLLQPAESIYVAAKSERKAQKSMHFHTCSGKFRPSRMNCTVMALSSVTCCKRVFA